MTPHEEISDLLRAAIAGQVEVRRLDLENWWVNSEPEAEIGAWTVQFFIEADWIYDIYHAYAPDGREFEFCPRDENCYIDLFLSDDEVERLCLILGRRARPNTGGELSR